MEPNTSKFTEIAIQLFRIIKFQNDENLQKDYEIQRIDEQENLQNYNHINLTKLEMTGY